MTIELDSVAANAPDNAEGATVRSGALRNQRRTRLW